MLLTPLLTGKRKNESVLQNRLFPAGTAGFCAENGPIRADEFLKKEEKWPLFPKKRVAAPKTV